jgi:hypothetical protein
MHDSQFLNHLGGMYYLLRARGGFIEALYSKTIARIDIIKVYTTYPIFIMLES